MTEKPKFVAAPLESYSTEDQAFFKFWYGHMLNDLMQPPLCSVDHATARYIWDAALSSVDAQPVATVAAHDPEDERDGVRFSLADWARLNALPAGTKLYTSLVPQAELAALGLAEGQIENLVDTLRGFAQAYPEDIFTPLTDGEIKHLGSLVDRASAAMGRHMSKFTTEAADMIERLYRAAPASPSLATERDAVDAQKVRNDALEEAAKVCETHTFGSPVAAHAIRALQSQPASAGKDAEGFYLASFKRKPSSGFVTWWGANNAGYTPYLNQAGIYRKDELEDGYHDSEYTVPVPVSFVREFEQRVVDYGMMVCGETFWSAANLRAAIAQKENG